MSQRSMPTPVRWMPVYALAALGVLATGCQPAPPPDTREADLQALREADAAFSKAATAKDLEGTVAFYADDATLLMGNAPANSGREAIHKVFGGMFAMQGFSLTWQVGRADVGRSGDLGYTMGAYQMTMPGPKGKAASDKGKYVTVWKKQADGKWKVVADIANSDLPAPTP